MNAMSPPPARPMTRITVMQGQSRVSAEPWIELTTVLGSCVSTCLFDPEAQLGGMNHFLLAEPPSIHPSNLVDEHYGVYLMELLINEMLANGAMKSRLRAHLYGGANLRVGMMPIGTANANVHHIANALAGETLPSAAANLLAEAGHLVEHGMHFRHDVLPIDLDHSAARRPQRHVEHGAVLGDVDLLAAEHGVDPRAEAGPFGQMDQQRERLFREPVLRVVEVQALGFADERLATLGIVGKELPEMEVADFGKVGRESLPGGTLLERQQGGRHAVHSPWILNSYARLASGRRKPADKTAYSCSGSAG